MANSLGDVGAGTGPQENFSYATQPTGPNLSSNGIRSLTPASEFLYPTITNPYAGAAPSLSGVDPNQDPVYSTYLQRLGLSDAQSKAQMARQNAYLDQTVAARRPLFQEQLDQGLHSAALQAAAHGTYNSGARQVGQAQIANRINTGKADFERNVAQQRSNMQDTYQQRLAQESLSRSGEELAARQRLVNQQLQDAAYGLPYTQQ